MFRKMVRWLVTTLISLLVSTACQHSPQQTALGQQTVSGPGKYSALVDISGSMKDRYQAPIQLRLHDVTKIDDVRTRLSFLPDLLTDGTHVDLILFDHESETTFSGVLESPEKRQELQQAIQNIRSRDGSTFLWRTLDSCLSQARTYIEEHPESKVRVLLYTDGMDMEKNPAFTHETIIQKHKDFLLSTVQLDWITIGFDLQGTIKSDLEKAGVRITKAAQPEDLIPLVARFKLSSLELSVGEELILEDTSIGPNEAERFVDWGDGSPFTKFTKSTSHVFDKPGEYKVRLALRKSGQIDRSWQTVIVRLPEVSPAKIVLTSDKIDELIVGQFIEAIDGSGAEPRSRAWHWAGKLISTDASVRIQVEEPGEHTLVLEHNDRYERVTRDSIDIRVNPPEPITANFRVISSQVMLGQPIVAINESAGKIPRYEWRANGTVISDAQYLEYTPDSAGTCVLSLTIWDEWGQTSTTQRTIEVLQPAKPEAIILAPTEVVPGSKVVCMDASTGTDGNAVWKLAGKLIGESKSIEFTAPEEPGEHLLVLEVEGPGGSAVAEHSLTILPYAQPKASFVLSSEQPFVGDLLHITDTSRGPIDHVIIEIVCPPQDALPRQKPCFEIELIDRSGSVRCDKPGPMTIRQKISGPGGQAISEKTVEVLSRAVPPRADFTVDRTTGRGSTTVTFASRSTGSIQYFELEPGDGSSTKRFDYSDTIRHDYSADGVYVAKITAYNDEGFSPSVWTSAEIRISAPWPAWAKGLLWQVPTALFLLGASVLVRNRLADLHSLNQMRLISGTLTVQPNSKPLDVKHFPLEGKSSEELVEFSPNAKIKLTLLEGSPSVIDAELLIDGSESFQASLEENRASQLGEYVVTFVP